MNYFNQNLHCFGTEHGKKINIHFKRGTLKALFHENVLFKMYSHLTIFIFTSLFFSCWLFAIEIGRSLKQHQGK